MSGLAPAARPCGSCPYRRDVPSGIWHPDEYAKLLAYDGPTWAQDRAPFLCHQRDGSLCAGWVECHGGSDLLAVRIGCAAGTIDDSTLDYMTDVPVFGSGREAAEHGLRDIEAPGARAVRMADGLIRSGLISGEDGGDE